MCESAAYLVTSKGEKKIMEDVVNMRPHGGSVYLTGLMGDEMTVKGIIKEIKLLDHKILIQGEEENL